MVERIDLERALDDLISNEEGMRFQGLAVALAQLRWPALIACERHNDLGLDAYANPRSSPDGVGRGLACSITTTFAKLNADAKAAKEHYGPFSLLIFATPRRVTKEAEKEWADKIRTEYGYELVVISRAEIIASLQSPDKAWMCRTHLRMAVPYQLPVSEVMRRAREAAADETAHWAAHPRLTGKPQITLNAVKLDESGIETQETLTTAHIRTLLLQGRRIVIEAPAGRGKTTTLIQLAKVNGESHGIPILIDLPRWIKSGLDILDYVARIPAFRARAIDSAALAQPPQDDPYLFLFNGWNEVSQLQSRDGDEMLRTLARDFPASGIIVATRTHHIAPPLPGSARFRLLPLTPDQRYQYLVQACGSGAARKLNAILSRDNVLDDLTRTPFILSEVTAIFRSGREIPRTRLSLLRAVVSLMAQSEEHRNHLQGDPLWGRAQDYLSSLATKLAARGDVVLWDAEARAVCHSVAERLRDAGQIATAPQPAEILNTISSHHILERLDYPEIGFRFEHQQFQEYYSALVLRDALCELSASGDLAQRDMFTKQYINDPAWEEPLRMIAADLGSVDNGIAAGIILVQSALRVDPVLSARLAHFGGPLIWNGVRTDMNSRLRSLYAVPSRQYRQCALAAMLATGSDEFTDILIPLLTNADQQVRLGTYRTGAEFHMSSLGAEWRQVVAGWKELHRIEFVTELTIHQGRAEVALSFVRSDPSSAVRLESLRALAWIGQRTEVTAVLQSMPDSEFSQVIQKFYPDEIPPALRERSISAYKALLAGTSDPKVRLQLTLALAELNDSDTATRLKSELGALPTALARELSDYTLRPAVDILRQSDPQWLSKWVTDLAVQGVLLREEWLSLILGIPKSLSERLLQRACTEDLRRSGGGGATAVLRATADPDLGSAVFMALRDRYRLLLADPQNEEKRAIEAQLRGLLRAIPRPVVLEGLSDVLAHEPQDDELAIVTDLFGGMGPENDVKDSLPDSLRQPLRRYLKSAVSLVLNQDDFRGEVKGHLSVAFAEVAELDDMADLIAMVRADIKRVREGRAAMARGDRSEKARGSPICWSPWHVQALVRLGHTYSEAILLDLLNEVEYEVDAAWGLQVIAKKAKPGRNAIMAVRHGQPTRDLRNVRGSRSEWLAGFNDGLRVKYAAIIRRHILNLLEESKTGDHNAIWYHHRLKELAKVLAALDPQDSAELILDIAELPARSDGWPRVALLEALVFANVALSAERALAILAPVVEQFRTHGIYNDSANLLGHVLCLLPFVDPPARGIARLRDLMSEFRLPLYNQRDLLMALGQCNDDSGLALLCDAPRQNDAGFQNIAREWLEAVAACPLPDARAILLGFVDPEVTDSIGDRTLPDYALDVVAGHVSELARADSSIAERIIQLSTQPISGQRRLILAKVIARLDSPQALLAGLNLIDDASPQPIPYELRKAFEDVFLEKRPSKDNQQSYTLVPRAAGDIKERLFEMVKHDPRRARSAYGLLGQIEEWRLEYGRPASEPRHPAYESGMLWPPPPPYGWEVLGTGEQPARELG